MSNTNKNNRPKHTKIIESEYFARDQQSKGLIVDLLDNSYTTRSSACTGRKLEDEFYNINCVELAKRLLGQILVRKACDGTLMKGKIVETESYLGGDDKASISYGGKMTNKSKPMYMAPGTSFVYVTYGMYNLINISSQGGGAAVLLRALEPTEGIELMSMNRNKFQPFKTKPKKLKKEIPPYLLCNGPAKLCISLNITKDQCNMQDLSTWSEMWIEEGEHIPKDKIVQSRRIGIDSAGEEWANKLLRFYVLDSKSVSKRDKLQETKLLKASSQSSK